MFPFSHCHTFGISFLCFLRSSPVSTENITSHFPLCLISSLVCSSKLLLSLCYDFLIFLFILPTSHFPLYVICNQTFIFLFSFTHFVFSFLCSQKFLSLKKASQPPIFLWSVILSYLFLSNYSSGSNSGGVCNKRGVINKGFAPTMLFLLLCMKYLIRAWWVDFSKKINKRGATFIRTTRVRQIVEIGLQVIQFRVLTHFSVKEQH